MPCECPMCQLEQSLRAKAGLNAAPSNGSTFSTLITIQGANSPFQLSGIYVASILVNGPDKDDVVATLLKVLADDSKFGFSVGNVEKSSHDAIEGKKLQVGAQNIHWKDSGAFTGEISPRNFSSSI